MFSVHCPRHGGVVLLGPADILTLGPDGGGAFALGYRCTCGYEGQWPPVSGEPGGMGGVPPTTAARAAREEWPERMAG